MKISELFSLLESKNCPLRSFSYEDCHEDGHARVCIDTVIDEHFVTLYFNCLTEIGHAEVMSGETFYFTQVSDLEDYLYTHVKYIYAVQNEDNELVFASSRQQDITKFRVSHRRTVGNTTEPVPTKVITAHEWAFSAARKEYPTCAK